MADKSISERRESLSEEQKAFDDQIEDRIRHGFVPDLRSLRRVPWFYNNVWRDPEYVRIHWMPKINFVIDIAKKGGGKVVELGCGSGFLCLELARNGLEVLGIDISPKSIEVAERYRRNGVARKGFGKLTYKCCDIATFDFGVNQFDTVIFFRTLHHMEDLSLLFRRINGGLKKKGSIIICEPVRDSFTKESAEMAAIFRALLPTWVPYKKKLKRLCSEKAWDEYVASIYREYTYKEEFKQSRMDNKAGSCEAIIKMVNRYFEIRAVSYSDAFIDKLIGALRGEDRYILARFLKFLDSLMVKRNLLHPTEISIHARKRSE